MEVIVILTHTTDKAMMERKIEQWAEVQELLIVEHTDGSIEFITGER